MTDPNSPIIDDDDLPARHNPIRNLPWIDSLTVVDVFQFRPTLENRLAEWCGGVVAVDNDSQLIVRVPGGGVAHLSDYVVLQDGKYRVEPADGFSHRYWPVGRDTGWTHRCFMEWESP